MLPFGFLMGYLRAYVHPGKDQYTVLPSEKRRMSKKLRKLDEDTLASVTKSYQTGTATQTAGYSSGNDDQSQLHSTKNHFSTDRNPADDYLFDIPRDPFISPLYASDEMLKLFPPIKIVVSSYFCI